MLPPAERRRDIGILLVIGQQLGRAERRHLLHTCQPHRAVITLGHSGFQGFQHRETVPVVVEMDIADATVVAETSHKQSVDDCHDQIAPW